jgi:hypothetical protein
MQTFSLLRIHSGQIVGWFAILAIAVLGGWATPAGANKIKATILDIGPVPYAPGATSDVARILITGAYNGNSLDTKNSALTIDRNGKEIIVPVAASVSSQPGGDMAAMKPGFISFGAAGSAKFQPGDTLTFNLIFNGNVAVKTSGGLYLDIDNMNTPTTTGALKIKSQSGTFDTSYTISNALDPTVFSDTSFTIENLAFLGDITTSELDALSLASIAAGNLPSGAVLASPSTFALSADGMQSFTDPFPEPGPDLWDVALGQLFDPATGATYAFIDGYEGGVVPEPPTYLLLGSAVAALGLGGLLRDRARRATAPCSEPSRA